MAITIQRIPRAGGASTTKTLAEWGLAMGSMDSAAWAVGQLSLVARGASPAFDNPVFEYLDTLKVFEGSTCIWWGPVISAGSTVQPAEQRTYVVADPLWWAQWVEFKIPTYPEPEDVGLVRGYAWLAWALNRVAAAHPVAYTTDDTAAFTVPVPDLRGSANCLEVIQRVARLHPLSSQWWDLSGATPLLRCALRTGLAPVSLARSRCQEPITLTPLHDKQLTAVWLEYVFTNSSGTRSAADDRAGTAPYTGPNTLHAAMKVGTNSALDGAANYNAAYEAQGYHIAQMLHDTWAALPWSGTLVVVGTPSNPLPTIRPGQLLNLTGGRTEWASMDAQVQRVSRTLGEVCDRLTIELGCGDQLGPTDLLALARTGVTSGGAAGRNPSPYENPTPQPQSLGEPGTYHDLNGGTGGGSPAGTIAFEEFGGVFEIVGCPPLDGIAVTPPRRWLAQAWAGTINGLQYYGNGTCGGSPTSTTAITLSGAAAWSAVTGAVTSNTGLYRNVWTNNTPASGVVENALAAGQNLDTQVGWGGSVGAIRAKAAASDTYTASGNCVDVMGDGTVSARDTGAWSTTLSDECTEDVAYAAQSAALEWVRPGTTAIRTVRTAGLSFIRRKLRYRTEHTETAGTEIWREGYYATDGSWVPGRWEAITVTTTLPTLTGLTPWGRYQLTVTLERRPVDSAGMATGDGSWSSAGTRTHMFIADILGEGGVGWQEIEAEDGYEIRVASTLVEVAP